MFKTCFKCHQRKEISKFYAHSKMADGYFNKCKKCAVKDVKKRYRSPEGNLRCKVYEKLRAATEHRKLAKKEYQRRSRASHLGRYRANTQVSNAVRDGRLERKPCEVCGNPKSEAHHDDYRKKLSVRWLCFRHHRHHHVQTCDRPM